MASDAAEKQQRVLPLFEYCALPTKTKFGLRVERDPKLRGLGILGRGQLFSTFHHDHLVEANKLIEVLLGAETFDEFVDLCHQARDFVNEALYVYAVSVAILHRGDCRGVSLPPIQEVFPDKFFPVETIYKAFKVANTHPDKEDEIIVDVEATGNILDPEYNLAYYREDIGINAHHWHWHLVYPSTWNAAVTGKHKDRKGEIFYYMHQQMCARYDCERLSNGLPRMIPFHNFHEKLEGYSAHLSSVINGLPYASRPAGMQLHDIHGIGVQDLERWRERILDAINLGSVTDADGRETILDETHGIDILGDIIESSHESKNPEYYGSLHNWGHVLMANVLDPDGRYQNNPGVMDDSATALRDPIFYRWHRFIDDMFNEYKKKLPSYTSDDLGFTGVEIDGVTVHAHKDNLVTTTFEEDTLDLSNALNFGRKGAVKIRYHHLDHEPFSYEIKVQNNTTKINHGTIRIFLAPIHDELGNVIKIDELRRLMIELDRFHATLKPGLNVITRSSRESSVTISKERKFSQLLKGEGTTEHSSEYCSCGWPDHLLIPKGNDKGMEFHLFVMVTDHLKDLVGQLTDKNVCADAVSYCGVKDDLYPDRKAMGYPFDRTIHADSVQDWLLSNMSVTKVKILHASGH
ncbi:hemocyanin C chain-like [Argiope bruennichi]|uniref:Hemocyanin C chain like protein n=1 Tax=Argiope bruennichi TaxID=94029 RepID=A0A8T0F4D6_ARGBR|nr:hemocyanin C chain-like [Argiope bruennichi]KAF8785135.1 Hemocyanin C chain like protein [Argiope bruennichi]